MPDSPYSADRHDFQADAPDAVPPDATVPRAQVAALDAVPPTADFDSPLPRLHAERMLTVNDIPGFAARGRILGLKIVDYRNRFEASPLAAKRADLRLSAQLLRLADVVAEHVPKGSPD